MIKMECISKKIMVLSLMFLTFISLASCTPEEENLILSDTPVNSENEDSDDSSPEEPETPPLGGNGRYLVLFTSRSGNTEQVADEIRRKLDCDILEVEPMTPYEKDYNAMLSRARRELDAIRQGSYPEIRTFVDEFDDYEMIFAGYPIWFGSMASPIQSFLHAHADKLSGKRIALFATSGSSGISASVVEAVNLCKNSEIINQTLLLTSSSMSQMKTRVSEWIEMTLQNQDVSENPDVTSLKMKITVGNRTITATMEDNAAARDLLSRLPLNVTLNDYGNVTEKIFYPVPELEIEGAPRGCSPIPGDITIYVPWGNVAIFCKSSSANNDLVKIGHIDNNGIDVLNVPGDVSVRLERME